MMGMVLIEFQTSQYLGADDIVRIEDAYGRAKSKYLAHEN